MRGFRKHSAWYTKGFPGGAQLRERLMHVRRLGELEMAVAGVERTLRFPPEAMRVLRGKRGGTQKVALPEGYLDDLEDATPPCAAAEVADSGG